MYVFKEVFYLMTSIAAIHFFYGSVVILREYLKQSICQGHCVYFKTLVAAIHYNSGLWLIPESVYLLEEIHCSPALYSSE